MIPRDSVVRFGTCTLHAKNSQTIKALVRALAPTRLFVAYRIEKQEDSIHFHSHEHNIISISKYVWNSWRHVWGTSEGLLGRILYYLYGNMAYVRMCCFVCRGNTELPWHRSRIPASTFSTVVDWTLSDFAWHWTERSATTRYTRDYYRRSEQ